MSWLLVALHCIVKLLLMSSSFGLSCSTSCLLLQVFCSVFSRILFGELKKYGTNSNTLSARATHMHSNKQQDKFSKTLALITC